MFKIIKNMLIKNQNFWSEESKLKKEKGTKKIRPYLKSKIAEKNLKRNQMEILEVDRA